jgi:hypothetical protein
MSSLVRVVSQSTMETNIVRHDTSNGVGPWFACRIRPVHAGGAVPKATRLV